MLSSQIFIPWLQSAGTWTVQIGPWSLPPVAWMPATAVIGAWALRVRSRSISGDARPSVGEDAPGEF
jgi:hypothetical protein